MSIFSSLCRQYILRRHRIGIGVHSPFAYRMVRDVIYAKGFYIAYPKVHRLTDGFPKRLRKEYFLIFRLIARLAPEGIRLSGSIEPQMELLTRMADTRPMLARGLGGYTPGKRILTICEAADLYNTFPDALLASGNMLVMRALKHAPHMLDKVIAHMKGGWVFADKRMLIAVSDAGEPLNRINVKIL